MNNIPARVDVEILRKDVEVAAIEAAEAERVYHAAAAVKRAINKIPKGKAGGGKGAKKAAHKTYQEARNDVHKKTIDLETAKMKFINAEQALDDILFTQATMNGNESSLPFGALAENSTDQPLRSACDSDKNNDLRSGGVNTEWQEPQDSDKNNDLGSAGVDTEWQEPQDSDKNNDFGSAGVDVEWEEPQTNVASQSRHSEVIPHMRRQHLSEELSCQQPVSEVNLSGGEPSDGSKEQRNDDSNVGFDIKRQGRQINAVSESHFSGLIQRDRHHLCEELTHRRNPLLDQGNDLEVAAGVERRWGPQVLVGNYVASELDVTGQVPHRTSDITTTMPTRVHDGHRSHETSSNQTLPEGSFDDPGKFGYTAKRSELSRDYEKDLDVLGSQGGPEEQDTAIPINPEKSYGPVTSSRVSRSTAKKLESARMGTQAQGADLRPTVIDEGEEDGWVVFLSDPVSDTDEEEKDRVTEVVKLKHPALTAEEKEMYRYMNMVEKKEYEKKARTAINLYLQENKRIDSGIRRMARLDPEFLPEAATTSRKLALHFLTSREGNIMCGYHAFKNKASFIRDGWGKPGMKVRGVPGRRKVGTSERQLRPHIAKGLGSCGCTIQDILLEFALSKQISISGFVDGSRRSEMMSFHDYMEPRIRSFAFQAILLMVPDISLNDFYTHGDTKNHKARVAKKRAHYWMKTMNDEASLEDGEHEVKSTELRESEI